MSKYAVETAFTAKDQVTKTYQRMGRAADGFSRKSSSAFRNATKEGYKFGTVVKGILAANMIRGGFAAVTNGLRTATNSFIEFDDVMVGAAARFDEIGPKSANFGKQLQQLKKDTIGAIAGTRYSAVDAATAMDTYAKAGYSVETAIGTMRSTLDLATASGEDLAATISMSNDLMGAFGMRSKNVQEQLKNQNRLNDVLAKSGLDANGELVDLFETLKMAAPSARQAGVAMEDLIAMAVTLSNAGIKGSQGATALKNAILNIPSTRMAPIFKANEIQIENPETGNIRKYSDILGDIGVKLSRLGNRKQTQILDQIFGRYGVAGGTNLIANLEQLSTSEERLRAAAGTSKDVADTINEYSIRSKLAVLSNAALLKSFEVLESMEIRGRKGLEGLITTVQSWNPEGLIMGLRTTAKVLSTLWSAIKPFLPALPYLIGYWVTFNGVLKIMAIGKAAWMFLRMFKAMRLAVGGMAALNMVMAANPVMLIASAVSLLIVGLVALEAKFGTLSKAFDRFKTAAQWFQAWKNDEISFGTWALANNDEARAQLDAMRAPNETEAQARGATGSWQGQLNISGAPEGSTMTEKSLGPPVFNWNMLGANP